MTRLFDPAEILNAKLDANAVRRDPLPMGETVAQIAGIDLKNGISKKSGTSWTRLDVKLEITDPEYLSTYADGDVEKAVTTLGILLDMTDSGQIATGPNKNIRLGRLREATGCNGKPLSALVGQFLRISINHKPHPDEPDVILDEITNFTAA